MLAKPPRSFAQRPQPVIFLLIKNPEEPRDRTDATTRVQICALSRERRHPLPPAARWDVARRLSVSSVIHDRPSTPRSRFWTVRAQASWSKRSTPVRAPTGWYITAIVVVNAYWFNNRRLLEPRRSLPAAACGRFDWNTDEVVGRPDVSRSGSEAVPGTRGAGRRVRVFGRVGPPRRHVCHDRWPARTVLGLDRPAAHRQAVSGPRRPARGRTTRPYAVVRRTRRRGDAVRGAAGPTGWGRRRAGAACACCAR